MGSKLIYVWWSLSALYLASAVAAIVFSVVVRISDTPGKLSDTTLRSLVISELDLNAALGLGALILISWIIGLYGVLTGMVKGKRQTAGLVAFNWSLVAIVMITTIIGAIIWFFTLQPRAELFEIWQVQPQATQQFLQDTLKCCGYFDATTAGGFNAPGGFCADVAAQTNATVVQACVTPIVAFEDYTLNNIFSLDFGFVAIQVALFLATCCLINVRTEEERFRLIDEKYGKYGGFV